MAGAPGRRATGGRGSRRDPKFDSKFTIDQEEKMASTSDGEVWVQLATRIPKTLHRELKLHCVKSDVSVMEFVVRALEEKLRREGGRSERRSARA
jgi:hypothetical protein